MHPIEMQIYSRYTHYPKQLFSLRKVGNASSAAQAHLCCSLTHTKNINLIFSQTSRLGSFAFQVQLLCFSFKASALPTPVILLQALQN